MPASIGLLLSGGCQRAQIGNGSQKVSAKPHASTREMPAYRPIMNCTPKFTSFTAPRRANDTKNVADLLEGLSPKAHELLSRRGARPSLGIRLPSSQALRDAAQREEACAKIATLSQFGGSYVKGRQRYPSGKRSRTWDPLLHAPKPRPHFSKRDAERDFVMWLQLAWCEAINEKVKEGELMPSVAANSARPGPFARVARECLKLVGAGHADVVGLINELNRRRRKMIKTACHLANLEQQSVVSGVSRLRTF